MNTDPDKTPLSAPCPNCGDVRCPAKWIPEASKLAHAEAQLDCERARSARLERERDTARAERDEPRMVTLPGWVNPMPVDEAIGVMEESASLRVEAAHRAEAEANERARHAEAVAKNLTDEKACILKNYEDAFRKMERAEASARSALEEAIRQRNVSEGAVTELRRCVEEECAAHRGTQAALDEERESIARLVEGWHISKGGYTEMAHVIREGAHTRRRSGAPTPATETREQALTACVRAANSDANGYGTESAAAIVLERRLNIGGPWGVAVLAEARRHDVLANEPALRPDTGEKGD